MLSKLDKKIGKYAIKNLSTYVVIIFGISYMLELFFEEFYYKLVFAPEMVFGEHQYWRLFTWIFTTPGKFDMLTLIGLACYLMIGNSLERAMGTFRYNVYVFGSFLFTWIGMVGSSLIVRQMILNGSLKNESDIMSYFAFSLFGAPCTMYIMMSIFLGFALVFSDRYLLLFFVIPMKAGWIAVIDLIYFAYEFVDCDNIITRATIVFGLLAFFLFYYALRRDEGLRRAKRAIYNSGYIRRQQERFNSGAARNANKVVNMNGGSAPITRHKCAICGRSENDGVELEFRFCSKCNGNYEYCSDHLYTHEHVQ